MRDQAVAFGSSVESPVRHAGWAMALRGAFAVVFGLIALGRPNIAAGAFVVVFAVYAFADGFLDFVLAARFGQVGLRWGWYAFEGVATVALGVIALAYPGVTLLALILLIGIRAVVLGIMELAAAFSLEGQATDSRWLLGLTGLLSIILGILIFCSPASGGLALVWTVGIYAIVFGIMLFALGLRTLTAEHQYERSFRGAPTPG